MALEDAARGYEARATMRRLAHEYHLSFTLNPGGGAFYADGFRCQISTVDDVADLAKLHKAIADWKARGG